MAASGVRTNSGDARRLGGIRVNDAWVRCVAVPGSAAAAHPAGCHAMLMNLSRPLKAGEQATLMLTFETAGNPAVTARVRE